MYPTARFDDDDSSTTTSSRWLGAFFPVALSLRIRRDVCSINLFSFIRRERCCPCFVLASSRAIFRIPRFPARVPNSGGSLVNCHNAATSPQVAKTANFEPHRHFEIFLPWPTSESMWVFGG